MTAAPRAMPGLFWGLSVKLITTIVVVILAVAIIIYLPSIASFRAGWLENRLRIGVVAGGVLDAVPDVMSLPRSLTDRLLNSAGVHAIVYRRDGQSQLIEVEDRPEPGAVVTADIRDGDPGRQIVGALDTLIFGGQRTLRIIGRSDAAEFSVVEILMPEAPLRADLFAYSRTTFLISLVIALITAAVLYLFFARTFIAPIRRLTDSMVAYRQAPENASLIITPEKRDDEIGVAEQELAAMQTEIFSMLRHRRHLADLGLAVAKINHDLRNTLTSAQLLSDQVVNIGDAKVQRLAPRLVTTLDKAIGFAQSVLDYGRQSVTPPVPAAVDLRTLVEEAAFEARLTAHPDIAFRNEVPDRTVINIDRDQMGRVLVNLMKNAREALEGVPSNGADHWVAIDYAADADQLVIGIADNGPGLPPRARQNLFVAFEGSARAGGTGLGLAIAREITEAHGGKLAFIETETGTRFEVSLPRTALVG
jgi:signal transduction histidine kinase